MEKMIRIAMQAKELDQAAAVFLECHVEPAVLLPFQGRWDAGKTTFIQSLCKVLGVPGEVNSPTFSLVNEYFTTTG